MKLPRFASRLFPAIVLWCGTAAATAIIVARGADPTVLEWTPRDEFLSRDRNVDFGNGLPAQVPIDPQVADGGHQAIPEPQTLLPMGIALIALSFGLRWGVRKRP